MPAKMPFEKFIKKGENPNGQVSQTANETVTGCNAMPPQQFKFNQSGDGTRWNDGNKAKPRPANRY